MLFWKRGRKEEQANSGETQPRLADGTATLADVLAPDGYLVDDDMVHVGPDRVVRVAYVADVPGRVSMGWLRELFTGDVDVTITISPLPNHVVIKDLTDYIQALDAQLYLDTERGDHREQSPKTRTRDGLWRLRDDIQTGGKWGMVTLDGYLMELHMKGLISRDEVVTKSQDPATVIEKLAEWEAAQAEAAAMNQGAPA